MARRAEGGERARAAAGKAGAARDERGSQSGRARLGERKRMGRKRGTGPISLPIP
jgi:hypothetical protein